MGNISKTYRTYKNFTKVWNVKDPSQRILEHALRIDDDIVWGYYDVSYVKDRNVLIIRNRFDGFICACEGGVEVNGIKYDPINEYDKFMEAIGQLGIGTGGPYVNSVNGQSGNVDIFNSVIGAAKATWDNQFLVNWTTSLNWGQNGVYQRSVYALSSAATKSRTITYNPFSVNLNPESVYNAVTDWSQAGSTFSYSLEALTNKIGVYNKATAFATTQHDLSVYMTVPGEEASLLPTNNNTAGGLYVNTSWNNPTSNQKNVAKFSADGERLYYYRTGYGSTAQVYTTALLVDAISNQYELRVEDTTGLRLRHFTSIGGSGTAAGHTLTASRLVSSNPDHGGRMNVWEDAVGLTVMTDGTSKQSYFRVTKDEFLYEWTDSAAPANNRTMAFTATAELNLWKNLAIYAKITSAKTLDDSKKTTDPENAVIQLRAEHFDDKFFEIDKTTKKIVTIDKSQGVEWKKWPGNTTQFKYIPAGVAPQPVTPERWDLLPAGIEIIANPLIDAKIKLVAENAGQDRDIELRQKTGDARPILYISSNWVDKFSEVFKQGMKTIFDNQVFKLKDLDTDPYLNVSIEDNHWWQQIFNSFEMDPESYAWAKKKSIVHAGPPNPTQNAMHIQVNPVWLNNVFDVSETAQESDRGCFHDFYDKGNKDGNHKLFYSWYNFARHHDINKNADHFGQKDQNFSLFYNEPEQSIYVSDIWVKNVVGATLNDLYRFNTSDFVVQQIVNAGEREISLQDSRRLSYQSVFNAAFKGLNDEASDMVAQRFGGNDQYFLRPSLRRIMRNRDQILGVFQEPFFSLELTSNFGSDLDFYKVCVNRGAWPWNIFDMSSTSVSTVFDMKKFILKQDDKDKKLFRISLQDSAVQISWASMKDTLKDHIDSDRFIFNKATASTPEILSLRRIYYDELKDTLSQELDSSSFDVNLTTPGTRPHIKLKAGALAITKDRWYDLFKEVFPNPVVSGHSNWGLDDANKRVIIKDLTFGQMLYGLQSAMAFDDKTKKIWTFTVDAINLVFNNVNMLDGANDYSYNVLNTALKFTPQTSTPPTPTAPTVGKYFKRVIVDRGTSSSHAYEGQVQINTKPDGDPTKSWLDPNAFAETASGQLTLSSNIATPNWAYIAGQLAGSDTIGNPPSTTVVKHMDDSFRIDSVNGINQLQLNIVPPEAIKPSLLNSSMQQDFFKNAVDVSFALSPQYFKWAETVVDPSQNPPKKAYNIVPRLDNSTLKMVWHDLNNPLQTVEPYITVYPANYGGAAQTIDISGNGIAVKTSGSTWAGFSDLFAQNLTSNPIQVESVERPQGVFKIGFRLKYDPWYLEVTRAGNLQPRWNLNRGLSGDVDGIGLNINEQCFKFRDGDKALDLRIDNTLKIDATTGLGVAASVQAGVQAEYPLVLDSNVAPPKISLVIQPNNGLQVTQGLGLGLNTNELWAAFRQNVVDPLQITYSSSTTSWSLELVLAANGGITAAPQAPSSDKKLRLLLPDTESLFSDATGLRLGLSPLSGLRHKQQSTGGYALDLAIGDGLQCVGTGNVPGKVGIKVTAPLTVSDADGLKINCVNAVSAPAIETALKIDTSASGKYDIEVDYAAPRLAMGAAPNTKYRTKCRLFYYFKDISVATAGVAGGVQLFDLKGLIDAHFTGPDYDPRKWPVTSSVEERSIGLALETWTVRGHDSDSTPNEVTVWKDQTVDNWYYVTFRSDASMDCTPKVYLQVHGSIPNPHAPWTISGTLVITYYGLVQT